MRSSIGRAMRQSSPRLVPWFWMGALVLSLWSACGSTLTLVSQWMDRTVTIDGQDREWGDLKTAVPKTPVQLGVINDADNLVLTLVTQDRALSRRILMQGLTVWFDPQAGENKAFGIRAPLGRAEREDGPPMEREGRRDRDADGEDEDRESRRERYEEAVEDAMQEVEILGSGEEKARKVRVQDLKGIEIALGAAGEGLVYELKVPLAATAEHPDAIGSSAGRWISVGLETPEMERGEPERGMRRGGRRGGGPGGWDDSVQPQVGGFPGGRRGEGPPMGRGGWGRDLGERLDVWAKVSLSPVETPAKP
jgi:hypothetical protein